MDKSEFPQRLTNKHRYTVSERLMILAEWEKCLDLGQKSAFCRRVGVSPRSVSGWSRDKRAGLLVPSDQKQNSYVMKKRERSDYIQLQRENAELKKQLETERGAVEVLGKASELLAALAKGSQSRTRTPSPPPPPAGTVQPPIPPAFRRPPPVE